MLQLEIESLQAAVEEATATSLDNCLAADLDAALEQRNIAQKKVTELTATLKKDRASKEATKKEVCSCTCMNLCLHFCNVFYFHLKTYIFIMFLYPYSTG